MKKQSKIIIAVLAVLLLAAAVLTIIHFHTREQVPEGALAIHQDSKITYIDVNKLNLVPVHGTVVNGKGEQKTIDADGIALKDLLREAKFDPAKIGSLNVKAADEFSAEISGAELNEDGKVFLYRNKEDGFTLVVFGDTNAKRHVKNVESFYLEN